MADVRHKLADGVSEYNTAGAAQPVLLINKEVDMQILAQSEMDQVAGGVLVSALLIGALAFTWYEAGHIQEFTEGFLDGAQL